MNDSSEYYHAYAMCRLVIYETDRDRFPHISRIMAELGGLLSEADRHRAMAGGRSSSGAFSFSLSEKEDLLSQWRGYTPSGGFSIGFKTSDLERLANENGLSLERCVYDDADKRRIIVEALLPIEADLANGVIGQEMIPGFEACGHREKADICGRLKMYAKVASLAGYLKNEGFREEHEWRIVGYPLNDKKVPTAYRGSGGRIIPYIELDISPQSPHPLPVGAIIVGPGQEFAMAENAIASMFRANEFTCSIKASRLTLRR